MKKFQKLLINILLSLALQIGILALLNHYFLVRNNIMVEAVKYVDTNGLQVPGEATDRKVSYDGKYIGYLIKGKLNIYSMEKAETLHLDETEENISFYKWLPDRDFVICGKTMLSNAVKSLEIHTVDVTTGDIRKYPPIEKVGSKSEIIGIELSPLTNMVYIQVKMNETDMDIYKYDIMDNLIYVMTVPLETKIVEMNFKDVLVYQKSQSSITLKKGSSGVSERIPLANDGRLLGCDKEDNIYIGTMDHNKNIDKIIVFKDSRVEEEDYTTVHLKKSYKYQDIYITSKGDIVCVNEKSLYITNKDKEIELSGKCEDILNEYILINNHNNLYTDKIE